MSGYLKSEHRNADSVRLALVRLQVIFAELIWLSETNLADPSESLKLKIVRQAMQTRSAVSALAETVAALK